MPLSDKEEKTLNLLTEAGNRAEMLSVMTMDADDYFESLGLLDDDVVHEYIGFHTREIVKVSALMNNHGPFAIVDVRELMGTAMLYGISVGYQMALMREAESQ